MKKNIWDLEGFDKLLEEFKRSPESFPNHQKFWFKKIVQLMEDFRGKPKPSHVQLELLDKDHE